MHKKSKIKENKSLKKRNIASKRTKCFFQIVDQLNEKKRRYFKKINNETHNHENDDVVSYVFARRAFMKRFEILIDIKYQHEISKFSKQILSFINNKYDNDNLNDSIINAKNIINALQNLRTKQLSNKIFIQTLNVFFQNQFDK